MIREQILKKVVNEGPLSTPVQRVLDLHAWRAEASMLVLQIREREPHLAAIIEAALERTSKLGPELNDEIDDQHVKAIGNLIRALRVRVAMPAFYCLMSKPDCDALVASIRADELVLRDVAAA